VKQYAEVFREIPALRRRLTQLCAAGSGTMMQAHEGMALDGTDISWDTLRQILREWRGRDVDLREVRPLEGGAINVTLALTTGDGVKSVLKISPHRVDHAHADEAMQLDMLRDIGLPVPRVYSWQLGSLDRPFSYVLMEFVEGVDWAAARSSCTAVDFDELQRELARLMLRLHERTSSHFMRVSSGHAERHDSWPAFYRRVFDPVVKEIEKNHLLPVKARKLVGKLHERLDRYLPSIESGRLLHWDLWHANLLVRCHAAGKWSISAVLDPDCKYGHPEAELAYLDLFHTVGKPFMEAYQHERKLPNEYHQVRKPIYQLYSLLNHLQMHGADRAKVVLAQIDKVSALV
jgi:fructosamine-3-kinase